MPMARNMGMTATAAAKNRKTGYSFANSTLPSKCKSELNSATPPKTCQLKIDLLVAGSSALSSDGV